MRALGLGDPDLRWGVDVTVAPAGGAPVRLLGVHLKSGCNAGDDPRDRDCAVLAEQRAVLEAWIDARAEEPVSAVVLGDLNRRVGLAGDSFWRAIDDGDPPAADLTLGGQGQDACCQARYPDFIDHIVLDARAAARLVPGSFEEYLYRDAPEAGRPSDHCPVSVRLTAR